LKKRRKPCLFMFGEHTFTPSKWAPKLMKTFSFEEHIFSNI